MKKLLLVSLFIFTLPAIGSGINANSASAPCTNNTLETYSGNSNLQADWQPNEIQLRWYNENERLTVQQSAQSCTYDGTLTIPSTQPTRTGYTFSGWEVKHTIPAGYTELEYLRSTGTQYIDIGLKANLNTKVNITLKWYDYTSNLFGYIFGCRDDQNSNAFVIGSHDAHILTTSRFYAQFDSVEVLYKDRVYFDLNKHTVSLSKDGFYVDGLLGATYSNPTAFTTAKNLALFARWSGSNFDKGKIDIYSFSMWENNSLVRNFVPARRNSDNVLGMWDMVTKTFFTNSGTGTFIAGPVVQ